MKKIFFLLFGINSLYSSPDEKPYSWWEMFQSAYQNITRLDTLLMYDNFHAVKNVEKNKIYRCKTLPYTRLEYYLNQHSEIKYIINLRPYKSNLWFGYEWYSNWYKQESAIAEKYGVKIVNIPLDGHKIPTRIQVSELFTIFQKIKEEKNSAVLFHCTHGADRTGYAVGAYELFLGQTIEEALQHLDKKYGHNEQKYPNMKKGLRILAEAIQKSGSTKDLQYYP